MKTALQALTAAVVAFQREIYQNLAREPKAIAVAFDDEVFDRIALVAAEHPEHVAGADTTGDRVELMIDGVRVIVRRHSAQVAARIAVAKMAVTP